MPDVATEDTPMLKTMMPEKKHKKAQRLLSWNQFGSVEMEALYQRYVFKIQQSAMSCLTFLLSVLCFCLAILTTAFVHNYTVYSLVLYSQGLIFFLLLIYMKADRMKERHFFVVNYFVLLFATVLASMSVPFPLEAVSGFEDHKFNMADGVWLVSFVVFNVYALMPIRTLLKCAFGLVVPLVHLVVSSYTCKELPDLLWRQVSPRQR